MSKKKQPPIGFGRSPFDDSPEDDSAEQPPQGPSAREPKAVPVFVDDLEALQILAAYNLVPLTPLSPMERQLLSVIAGLEQRITDLEA